MISLFARDLYSHSALQLAWRKHIFAAVPGSNDRGLERPARTLWSLPAPASRLVCTLSYLSRSTRTRTRWLPALPACYITGIWVSLPNTILSDVMSARTAMLRATLLRLLPLLHT